jgi:hypothetical protein
LYPCRVPLDLVVPDLLTSPARDLRLPHAERWLARADSQRVDVRGIESWLARAFGVAEPVPVAAITLAGDIGAREGQWLRADPAHLRIGQDSVALHDASILEVTREEAAALLEALQANFASDGLEFAAPRPDRWYVRVPEGEMPRTTPLAEALGRNIFQLLPKGSGRINWGSAITETQMLMSAHPVNTTREEQGKAAINSVWFWGGGTLASQPVSTYSLVHAHEPLARGLGTLAGVRVLEPVDFAHVDAVRASEWVLVVLDGLTAALHSGDPDAWAITARQLDEQWFAHLGAAAERFDGVRLVLPGARDTLVATISPTAKWRWLRSRKPLATYA